MLIPITQLLHYKFEKKEIVFYLLFQGSQTQARDLQNKDTVDLAPASSEYHNLLNTLKHIAFFRVF